MEDYGAVGDERGKNLVAGIIAKPAANDNIVLHILEWRWGKVTSLSKTPQSLQGSGSRVLTAKPCGNGRPQRAAPIQVI